MEQRIVQVVNVASIAFLMGYLTVEHIWPYIKRRWLARSAIQRKLQLKKAVSLTKHEEELAYGALHPDEILTTFAGILDIGGNEEAMRRLQQVAELLLSQSVIAQWRGSRLFRAPAGVLLYGPPGCGKTMIARALAKQSGVRFLAANMATVMDKWVGETEKYIEALFSLARKISPVIIFVDEIDALTRKRSNFDREWSSSMKSQLLASWDGLYAETNGQVMILGATNRPQDIDEAFLRRMPLQIKVDMPDEGQRRAILRLMLADLPVDSEQIDVRMISRITEGFSGSDLHELCRRVVLECSLQGQSLETESFCQEAARLAFERQQCSGYLDYNSPNSSSSHP